MNRTIWLAIALCSLLCLLAGIMLGPYQIRDAEEYVYLAENLKHDGIHYAGDLNAPPDLRLYSKRPMLYPVFLGLNNSGNFPLVYFLQAFFVFLLFFTGLVLSRTLGHRNKGIVRWYSILFLLNLPLFFTAQFILSDLLLALLVSFIVYALIKFRQSGRTAYLSFISVIVCVSILVKPVMLPAALLCIPACILLFFRYKVRNFYLLSPAGLVLIVCLLNLNYTGVFQYSSISSINKAQYNTKLMIAQDKGMAESQQFMSSDHFFIPHSKSENKEYSYQMDSLAYKLIRANPLAYIKVHITGMLKMLFDPGRFEIYTFTGSDTNSSELSPLLYSGEWSALLRELRKNGFAFYLLIILGFVSVIKVAGLLLACTGIKRSPILILLVPVFYFLVLSGPVGAFRFLLPATIPLLLLSSYGLNLLINFFKK